MKASLMLGILMILAAVAAAQSSDYIVIRKKDRVVHTYFAGGFLSAQALNGFNINGFIRDIRHDSIFVVQQNTELAATDFGSAIDTVFYTLGFDYKEVSRFNVSSRFVHGFRPGAKTGGFFGRILPTMMTIGGLGYVVLELVNGQYRHEQVDAHNKTPSLLVAGAVAAGGIVWSRLQHAAERRPQRYEVLYVHKR